MAHRGYLIALCLLVLCLPGGIRAGNGEAVLTKEKAAAVLRRYVIEKGPWRPDQIEVGVQPFTAPSLPAGRYEWRIVRSPRGLTPGSHSFLLGTRPEGKREVKVWVRAEIRVFGVVVVTSRPFARYEVLFPEGVRVERRELGLLSMRAFTTLEEAVGKQASRAIEVNEIVTPSMIELPKVVRRGNKVSLLYETSNLKVESWGEAMGGGSVGDIIRVRNGSSGKVLEGRILGARVVQVNWQ